MPFSFASNIQQESGGQQFDRNGNPLRSSKGAVGVAQVMPGTGPEAARDAGLPWDPVRFQQDRDYNLALGAAYHAKLTRKYGDSVLASAAYNGGPSRLDGLIARYGRDGALAHMPQETRDYVHAVHGVHVPGANDYHNSQNNSLVGIPSMPPDRIIPDSTSMLDSVMNAATSPTPTATQGGTATTGAGRFPVVDPFTMGTQMRGAAQGVSSALDSQNQFLDHMETVLDQTQRERVDRVQQQVQQKDQINQTIGGETQSMIDRVTPIMQRRAQIAAQLYKTTNMNPIVRGVLSIFDPNYDTKHLEGKLQQTDEVLNTYGHDYEYMTNLRQRLSDLVDRHAAGGEAMEHVTLQNLDENSQLISHTIGAANQRFAFLGDEVNQSDNLIRAQMQASDRAITQMAPADIETALNRAQHSPTGTTMVDGVELSFGELRQRSLGLKEQKMSFRSQQIALQRGEGDLADYHAGKWAENATESQLREAIQSNGNYHGMQVPMTMLTQQLAVRGQATQMQVADIQRGNSTLQLAHDLLGMQGDLNTVNVRMRSMFGGAEPPEIRDAAIQITRGMDDVNRQLAEAKAKGPSVLNDTSLALRDRAQALRQNYMKAIDTVATRMSGGDKGAAGWISTFLRGGKLDANQSAEALYYYSQKGGLPTGMRSSPQARAAFLAAQTATTHVDGIIQSQGLHISQQQRKAMIMREIQSRAPAAYQSGSFNDLIAVIPRVAQQTRDPFGAVSQQDYDGARRQSETVPYEELGRTLGTTPEIARQVMAGTYRGDHAQEYNDKVTGENLRSQFIARQMSVFVSALDRSPSAAHAGIKPSVALSQFLQGPHMVQLAQQYEQTSRGASFGDFLGGGLGQGQLPERISRWGHLIQNQVADNRIAEETAGPVAYNRYIKNPYHRAQVILSSMPGLNQGEVTALVQGLQQVVPNKGGDIGGPESQALESAIRTHKFENPALERIRRIAAQQWETTSATVDRAITTAWSQGASRGN